MERKPRFHPIRFAITPFQTIDTVKALISFMTILEQDLFYSACIWSVFSNIDKTHVPDDEKVITILSAIAAMVHHLRLTVPLPDERPSALSWQGFDEWWAFWRGLHYLFKLPLECRAWKLSWPKAKERIRTYWPNCLLWNLMRIHWEQQWTGKKTKPLGLLCAFCIASNLASWAEVLYSYIVCHHFQVRLIMAGIYNNWEAYFIVSYTRICFALPLSGLYCNISWSE